MVQEGIPVGILKEQVAFPVGIRTAVTEIGNPVHVVPTVGITVAPETNFNRAETEILTVQMEDMNMLWNTKSNSNKYNQDRYDGSGKRMTKLVQLPYRVLLKDLQVVSFIQKACLTSILSS